MTRFEQLGIRVEPITRLHRHELQDLARRTPTRTDLGKFPVCYLCERAHEPLAPHRGRALCADCAVIWNLRAFRG